MLIKATNTSYPMHYLHVVRGRLWEKDEEFSAIEGHLKGIELKTHNRPDGSFKALHLIFEDSKAAEAYDITFGLDRLLVYRILSCLSSSKSLNRNIRLEFGTSNGLSTVVTFVDGIKIFWNSRSIPEDPNERLEWGLEQCRKINSKLLIKSHV